MSIESRDGTLSLTTGASGFAAVFLGLPLGFGAAALLPVKAPRVLPVSSDHAGKTAKGFGASSFWGV